MSARSQYKKIKTAMCHWCDYAFLCHNKSKKCLKHSHTRQKEKKVFEMYQK